MDEPNGQPEPGPEPIPEPVPEPGPGPQPVPTSVRARPNLERLTQQRFDAIENLA
jgi:hypothetical protein